MISIIETSEKWANPKFSIPKFTLAYLPELKDFLKKNICTPTHLVGISFEKNLNFDSLTKN